MTTKKPAKSGKKRNPFYTILYIPDAEYITVKEYENWDPKRYMYKTVTKRLLTFKTEEDAYKHLFNEHFTRWMGRERNLQILLLVSELSKNNPDIAYKIFLDENKDVKVFNHVTLVGYLRRNKMFKEAFKALCDVVVVMGLGALGKAKRVCFEHFIVDEHPPHTDINTLFISHLVNDDEDDDE